MVAVPAEEVATVAAHVLQGRLQHAPAVTRAPMVVSEDVSHGLYSFSKIKIIHSPCCRVVLDALPCRSEQPAFVPLRA